MGAAKDMLSKVFGFMKRAGRKPPLHAPSAPPAAQALNDKVLLEMEKKMARPSFTPRHSLADSEMLHHYRFLGGPARRLAREAEQVAAAGGKLLPPPKPLNFNKETFPNHITHGRPPHLPDA